MKPFFLLYLILSITACSQQNSVAKKQQNLLNAAKEAQYKLNLQYADKEKSPLDSADLARFRQLDFFPITSKYIVKASFVKNEFPVPFKMNTSTDRRPVYQKYGTLYFEMDGEKHQLAAYQSLDPRNSEEDKQYISVPFTDLTSGKESYGGGRYIDLKLPLNALVVLDFNQAYNPYCAYSHRWSCIIPPQENALKVAIKAGVKKYH